MAKCAARFSLLCRSEWPAHKVGRQRTQTLPGKTQNPQSRKDHTVHQARERLAKGSSTVAEDHKSAYQTRGIEWAEED